MRLNFWRLGNAALSAATSLDEKPSEKQVRAMMASLHDKLQSKYGNSDAIAMMVESLKLDVRRKTTRDDVLRLLRTTREDMLHFLHQKESQHFKVPSLPFATASVAARGSEYLARVFEAVEADARPRVTFAEFSAMLELADHTGTASS